MTMAIHPAPRPVCPPTGCHHEASIRACEGCGSTAGVTVTHLRTGGTYAVCDTCWERGRRGWHRGAAR
jgi:hypothetical protein